MSDQYHSMETTGATQGQPQRRRLPKLTVPTNPAGASSDETPRTVTSDESARQRRRIQQQLARQHTPNGRETVSPPAVKDVIIEINGFPKTFYVQYLASVATPI